MAPEASRSQGGQIPLRLRDRVGHEDRVLLADGLAQAAGDARTRVHLGDLVERLLERVLDQVDAVERTDVDAEFAAGAEVAVDDGLGDLLGLDLLDQLPLLVLDAGDGAVPGADRAVDAAVGVDDVFLGLVAGDRVGGTLDLADPAPDARFGDEMRHKARSDNPLRGSSQVEKYHNRLLRRRRAGANFWRERALGTVGDSTDEPRSACRHPGTLRGGPGR